MLSEKCLGIVVTIISGKKVCVCACVLHAVSIALRALAKQLLQGIQIRKGPLSSDCVVGVCDITESRMKSEQKNTEEILSGGKGETKECECVSHH